ncbi:MAG: hypothetical protein HDT09_01700, partial [Bacteroidales bacterium]|nr:hypothetical protein [Bacteroidales bacterium]
VETQLAVAMRNTMGARGDEIQSIKDLCTAQQELGVIGDEVQLAGAQEMATYLKQKQSLETLIPVMNDMLAQQYGLASSQENAAQIASMLGKVMNGQTGALSKYGYSFTEAQEKVLQFGTEEERAAVLAAIVSERVGGMNQALAQTDSGRMQQIANSFGDMKEKIGSFVIDVAPFVSITSQIISAAAATFTLIEGLNTISTTTYGLIKSVSLATVAFIKNKAAALAVAAAQKLVAAATALWSGAQKILNLILSANPIGVIIMGVASLVAGLIYAYNNCESFREIVDKVWASIKSLADVIMKSLVKAFQWLVDKCKIAWDWLKNILGLGGKKVELELSVSKPTNDLEDLENKYANYQDPKKNPAKLPTPRANNDPVWTENASSLKQITGNIDYLFAELQDASIERAALLNKQIAELQQRADAIRSAGTEPMFNDDASTLEEIGQNIAILQSRLQKATIEDAAEINKQLAEWVSREDAIRNAGITPQENKPKELTLNADAKSLGDIQGNIEYYNQELLKATSPEMAAGLNQQKKHWEELAESIRNAGLESKDTNELMLDGISALGGSMKGLGSALELPALDVAGTLAQAIVTMIQGYAAATAQAATLGPWVWAGFAAAGLAQLTAIISSVKSAAGFATGGIVPGNSPSGDKLLARVNSGEMILNKSQQSRLFRMLNAPVMTMPDIALPGATSATIRAHDWDSVFGGVRTNLRPAGEPVVVGGTLRASGRDLVCVLSNETRIASKSGRRTNIKI